MRMRDGVDLLRRSRAEQSWDRQSRDRLEAHQQASLAALIRHAAESCPFHGERLAGQPATVTDLPIMRRSDLVDSFDSIVADRRLTRTAVEEHVMSMSHGDPLLFGEYRILTTSGTSGVTTYVPFDRSSWRSVLAAYPRVSAVFGCSPRWPRLRQALLTAGGPLHMTNRMAVSNDLPAFARLRLDVTEATSSLAAALMDFNPDILAGYPTVIAALAEEQLAGRLDISPRWIFCGSEQLRLSLRALIREAWVDPVDVYATTETGGVLAFECPERAGLHLREEHCIVEAVDAQDRPVLDGEPGVGLLVTSWLNRSLPLIRYRLDDAVTIVSEPCACGRPTRRVVALNGRRGRRRAPAGRRRPDSQRAPQSLRRDDRRSPRGGAISGDPPAVGDRALHRSQGGGRGRLGRRADRPARDTASGPWSCAAAHPGERR